MIWPNAGAPVRNTGIFVGVFVLGTYSNDTGVHLCKAAMIYLHEIRVPSVGIMLTEWVPAVNSP